MHVIHPNYSTHCKYCHTLLVGKIQFIVHMIYNHDVDYEELIDCWSTIEIESNGLLN